MPAITKRTTLAAPFALILLLVMLNTAKSTDQLIFDGAFETGDATQWEELHYNTHHDKNRQFSIVSSPTREGKFAAKLTVHDNDQYADTSGERCDLLRPEKYDEKEGDEFWYAWSTLFPESWQAPQDWFVIADWHSRYDDVCQLLQIEVSTDNALIAKVLSGDVTDYHCFNGAARPATFSTEKNIAVALTPGLWNDFIVHVKWTTKPDGIIEIFYKNEDQTHFEKVVNLRHIPTLQYQSDINQPLSPYFKLAHYRSSKNSHTSVLFHDGFRQGKTRQSIVSGGLYELGDID